MDLPPLPGAAAEEKKDGLKWEGEDEEEEEPAAVASAPSVPRPAKKKTLKEKLREREEAEQRKAVERAAKVDPLADKLNKQRLVEQSDFAAAKDTFGGADAGDSALDSFLPKTEADFIEYAGMVAAKLTNYDNSAYYKVLLKEVLRKATENLSSEETKQISTSMTVLVNEKQKEEKAKQGDKKKKKNQKKAVVMDRDDEYEMFGPGGGNTGYADECVPRARERERALGRRARHHRAPSGFDGRCCACGPQPVWRPSKLLTRPPRLAARRSPPLSRAGMTSCKEPTSFARAVRTRASSLRRQAARPGDALRAGARRPLACARGGWGGSVIIRVNPNARNRNRASHPAAVGSRPRGAGGRRGTRAHRRRRLSAPARGEQP